MEIEMSAMDVLGSNYLPGDPRLVNEIVYELKSQGIFDQFRKECIADVDTKPAYQNLRQRVEGSVAGFLKKQIWKPDMNKNQVREMLKKNIYESGFLETGVERIVDQVVNPKINTVFLPKVEDVVYSFLGVERPQKSDEEEKKFGGTKMDVLDSLLPTDLEAVSPESDMAEEKNLKKEETTVMEDDCKNDDDESPPFEPLDSQILTEMHEENSIESHLSGFSGLASHDSNQGQEIKLQQETSNQDSHLSKPSSESRMSASTSDDNEAKFGDDFDTKKSDKNLEDNKKGKNEKSRSRSHSHRRDDKDRKDHHSKSSKSSSRDKSRDKRSSKSDSKHEKELNGKKESESKKDRERDRRSSHSKHSSKERSSSKKEEDKSKSSRTNHKDSKSKDDRSKHRKSDTHTSRHSKDKKDSKKDKDDHFSSKNKKHRRRSTDRDSNDGHSENKSSTSSLTGSTSSTQSRSKMEQSSETTTSSGDSGNSEGTESNENHEKEQKLKIIKPKFASNIHEARKLMKIRKHLNKLEKKGQLNFEHKAASPVTVDTTVKADSPELVSPPLHNSIITMESWDALEAKLHQQLKNVNYNSYEEYSDDYRTDEIIVETVETVPKTIEAVTETIETQETVQTSESCVEPHETSEEHMESEPTPIETNEVLTETSEERPSKTVIEDHLDFELELTTLPSAEFQTNKIEVEVEVEVSDAGFKEQRMTRIHSADDENCGFMCSCFEEALPPISKRFLKYITSKMKDLENSIKQLSVGDSVKENVGEGLKRKRETDKVGVVKKRKVNNNSCGFKKSKVIDASDLLVHNGVFTLPLSPAESDKSDKKIEKGKNNVSPKGLGKKAQRYSSDDLYKPRLFFNSSRRRGNRNVQPD